MSRARDAAACAVMLLAVLAVPASGQTCDPALVEEGIAAYRALRLPEATELLERAARAERNEGSCAGERTFTYLGAAQLFQGMDEEAAESFRRSVLLAPRYEPDTLAFPPAVTDLYGRVRRQTRAVAVEFPRESEVAPGSDSVRVRVFATSDYPVVVAIAPESSPLLGVTLYRGPGADSLDVYWSALGPDGRPAPPGRYVVTASPEDTDDGDEGTGRVVLVATDPLGRRVGSHRGSAWGVVIPLGQALLAGSAAVAMHGLVASEGDGAGYRFAVAGAIGAAGIVGAARHLMRSADDTGPPRLLIRPASADAAAQRPSAAPGGR